MDLMENTNKQFSFRWRDAVILVIAVAVTAASAFAAYRKPAVKAQLAVSTPEGEYLYPINKDRIIEAKGFIGNSTIEIKDGSVRFTDSPCDNKVCVNHGVLTGGFDFAACLPNGVMIMVENAEETNIDTMAK